MDDAGHLVWETLDSETVMRTPVFDVVSIKRRSTDGRVGKFYRLDAPRWATVVPLAQDDSGRSCFVMVRQFRHGSGAVTIEFPAGMVDHGELPQDAAKRELYEETGFEASLPLELLGEVSPNPAFMGNRLSVFLARGLRRTGGQTLDQNEQLDILLVPVQEVLSSMGTGLYDNGIMLIAQALFDRYAQEHPDVCG